MAHTYSMHQHGEDWYGTEKIEKIGENWMG